MLITRVMRIAGAPLLLTGLLLGSTVASAHHSFAMFDRTQDMTLQGTVTSVDYANPHVWVFMTVMNENNEPIEWGMEGGNLGGLYRRGWAKDTVQEGMEITMQIHPLRNGNPGGQIMRVTLADGTVL